MSSVCLPVQIDHVEATPITSPNSNRTNVTIYSYFIYLRLKVALDNFPNGLL